MSLAGTANTRPWRIAVLGVAALSVALALVGEAMVVLRLDDLFLRLNERFFWPRHPAHAISPDALFGQAIGFGWWAGISATQAFLVARLDDAPLRTAARALLIGHVTWYVLDSSGSIATGALVNAATNTLYFVLLGVPLAALSR